MKFKVSPLYIETPRQATASGFNKLKLILIIFSFVGLLLLAGQLGQGFGMFATSASAATSSETDRQRLILQTKAQAPEQVLTKRDTNRFIDASGQLLQDLAVSIAHVSSLVNPDNTIISLNRPIS